MLTLTSFYQSSYYKKIKKLKKIFCRRKLPFNEWMGFDENDYDSLVNNDFYSRQATLFFSRDRLYKLAGNSIVINML
jgi:hypothetical protein